MDSYFSPLIDRIEGKIPNQAHIGLCAIPNEAEIKNTLFSMGAEKAAGPDGLTAGFLQKYWQTMKQAIIHNIREAFRTATVPTIWLKSNIILIPKI